MYKKSLLFVLTLALMTSNMTFGGTVWEAQISSGGDDVEEHLDSGELDTGSSDMEMPYDDSGNPPSDPQLIGIRFPNVDIPAGATIDNAWIQFTSDDEYLSGGPVNLAIWGWKEPNPGGFSGSGAVSSVPRTSVFAKWSDLPEWVSGDRGPDQQTSDISVVIQELIDQPGWVFGNAMALIIGDDPDNPSNGIRSALTGAASGPLLHIEYSSKIAFSPDPVNGSIHSDTWVSLSWEPGDTSASSDVYFSDILADVEARAEAAFQGNQVSAFFVVGFPGKPLPEGLIPGTTYYWRIDSIEADGTTKYEGVVWSFTVAPRTAYEPDPADGAESVSLEPTLRWTPGFGAKLHTVYFGESFEEVDAATGSPPQGITTFSPGELKMAKTYYWRVDEFDILETHKGDVWSFSTEGAVQALNPANKAVDVSQTPVLTWAPGFGATYDVYFGADPGALEKKGSGSLGEESFEPGQLEWNTTYYWRVDEANSANADSPWTGSLWSFTTANFLIIDDMEAYNDYAPDDPLSNRIFNAWLDGYGDPTNGALVGYANAPFAEQAIVHNGNQSMPFEYDNSAAGKSEATLTLTTNKDWTIKGVNKLTIWYRGSNSNSAETMYVTLNGSATVDNDNPDAAKSPSWTEWNIDLQAFADQGVNLSNVTSITLGLRTVGGGTGMLFFDDIRLYPPAE